MEATLLLAAGCASASPMKITDYERLHVYALRSSDRLLKAAMAPALEDLLETKDRVALELASKAQRRGDLLSSAAKDQLDALHLRLLELGDTGGQQLEILRTVVECALEIDHQLYSYWRQVERQRLEGGGSR